MPGLLSPIAAAACTAVAAAALAGFVAASPSFAQSPGTGSAVATQSHGAGSPAATLYALNCMGCHPAPMARAYDAGPLRGEFFHNDKGRNFFIRMPADGRRLSAAQEARLLEEVLTWKRGCAAIRQDAPMVGYYGEPSAR